MKISDVRVEVFKYESAVVEDSEGHLHPGPKREARNALVTVVTDDGAAGYSFGSPDLLRESVMERHVRPALLGRDPFDRERIWQDLFKWQRLGWGAFSDNAVAGVATALWDLAGPGYLMPNPRTASSSISTPSPGLSGIRSMPSSSSWNGSASMPSM